MGDEVERAEHEGIAELAAAASELAQLAAEAEHLADEERTATETALVPMGAGSALEIKTRLALTRKRVVAKRTEVEAAVSRVRELAERQAQMARQVIAPLEKQVRLLEEGIEAVKLYLGDDESIVTLTDGTPAPVDEPLVVRQLVLAMDEECAVAAEDGGIDFMDIDAFDRWLTDDPAHLAQVLPEQKAVVALVPRRHEKEYAADPWSSAAMNAANAQTYLLIRNGGRLFRYCPDFVVGEHLVPLRNEFTKFFETPGHGRPGERRAVPLRPGSRQWAEAEERADARKRHFMKVALVLQGLIDRSTIFHPQPPDLSVIDPASYDAGHVTIVTDAEGALGTGQETFGEWQRRLNGRLTVGMRIVGAFDAQPFRSELMVERWYAGGKARVHERISPRCDDRPEPGALYTLEDRATLYGSSGFLFRFVRTREVWDPKVRESRVPEVRASCTVLPSDRFILAYDLAEVADMERFLSSRENRWQYAYMFPVLQRAIALKRQEEAEEAPFRLMVAGALAQRTGVDVADAEAAVPGLVSWYKFARRHHRPLVGDDPRIVSAIVAEHRRRLAARVDEAEEAGVVAEMLAAHPDLLYVGRKKDGTYVAYVPQEPDDQAFVKEITRTPGGRERVVEWRLPGTRPARLRPLYESPEWGRWDLGASLVTELSGPERTAGAQAILAQLDPEWGAPLAVTWTRSYDSAFGAGRGNEVFWVWLKDAAALVDDEHPLTGESHDVGVVNGEVGWRRRRGGQLVVGTVRQPYGRYSSVFDSRRDEPIWLAHTSRRIEVVWCDEAAVAALRAEHERYQAAGERRDALAAIARELEDSIRQGWVARAEHEAYERFIADYADPDRWEAHRKGLKVDYPHHPNGGLERLVRGLVEAGVQLGGMRVGEAVAVGESVLGERVEVPGDLVGLAFAVGEDESPGEGSSGGACSSGG